MNYSEIVSHLLTAVPDFGAADRTWNADLPHDVFGSFALFLCERIRQGKVGSWLDQAFEFLNEMASSKDDAVVNLLVVSVLEIIADDDKCRTFAIAHLSDQGRSLLERVISDWGPER